MPDKRRKETAERIEGPTIEQQDWDAIQSGQPVPEKIPANGDIPYGPSGEPTGELPEEDDDNPYQESDEALPDDIEEAAIKRNPSKEKPGFDET
jgi:hypothetical protein